MQIPMQLAFEGKEPIEAARSEIDREVEQLEKCSRDIIGCRVVVVTPSRKHRRGAGFEIRI